MVELPSDRRELAPSCARVRRRLVRLVLFANRESTLGGMVVHFLSRHRNSPPVFSPVSSGGISCELSLSFEHPRWGAGKTSGCPA